MACWNLTLKLSTVICRNFLILKSVLNNQSPLDEGLCSLYITCKLKLWLPLPPWNVVAHVSLFVSLSKVWVSVSEGQRLLFQVSVPVMLGQEVYARALYHLVSTSPCKQTEIFQTVQVFWLVDSTGRTPACLTCLSSLLSERCNICTIVFLIRTFKKILSIYVFCGKKLVHSRSYWTRPGCRLKGDRGQKMFWSKFTPVVGLNTLRTTCSELELDYKTNKFVNLLNSFLSCSLQNRRNFLRISGEQRRKRGDREAFLALLPSHATCASRSPRFRLCSPEMRQKLRLFCWLPFLLHYKYCLLKSIIIVHRTFVELRGAFSSNVNGYKIESLTPILISINLRMKYSDADFRFSKVDQSSFQIWTECQLLYLFFYLVRRLSRTGADEERGSESSSTTNGGEGLMSKEGVDVFLSTSKLSSPWRVRSLNWFTLVSPESCRYLKGRCDGLAESCSCHQESRR